MFEGWTMKDVQIRLQEILLADHPLTQEQRYALNGVIQMCDVWNRMAGGFHKVVQERLGSAGTSQVVVCSSTCRTVTGRDTDGYCSVCQDQAF